jgi:hypothetical protein
LDVARHPEKAKPTGRKLRAKDRPLADDFLADDEFVKLLHVWFGNIARVLQPGRAFYAWGGYSNCGLHRSYSAFSELTASDFAGRLTGLRT